VWGPEGLDEVEAELLGPPEELKGKDVLEIGAGAAQCSRWLAAQGARPVALDISHRQLQHALRIGGSFPLVCADAGSLPFGDASFDLACSAYGALPFVADPVLVLREVRRVLRPGGRFVFSVTHPIRWAFPDEPGPEGLSVSGSYFDRTPYVEQYTENGMGRAVYVEHHRTVGDRVRDVVAAGLRLVDLVEPEWPAWNTAEWGGWSPLRGHLIPGTAIFVCERD
jgi:ubiquinone/menaquinone biosynthesis C-methylase UbiE